MVKRSLSYFEASTPTGKQHYTEVCMYEELPVECEGDCDGDDIPNAALAL